MLVRLALLLAALWLACCSASVRQLHWTQPSNAVTRSVECVVRPASGIEYAPTLYGDSLRTRPHVPAGIGAPDSAWAWPVPDDRSTYIAWLMPCNGAGCGPWSNRLVAASGVPDTLHVLDRRDGKPMPQPSWKWARRGAVGWSYAPGDTTPAVIVMQEVRQRQESVRLVALYGYWALRGLRVVPPDFNPPPREVP